MQLFAFVLLLFQFVAAKLEWRFQNVDRVVKLSNVSIGSAGQQFPLSAYFNNWCPGLWIEGPYKGPVGFDISASVSFRRVGIVYNSILAQDDITIKSPSGANQLLKQQTFNIIDRDGYCRFDYEESVLNLVHETKLRNNTFLDSLFAKEKEHILVVVYDSIPFSPRYGAVGTFTFGERPGVCDAKWSLFNETVHIEGDAQGNDDFTHWNVVLDKISIGKFAAYSPGTAFIQIGGGDFVIGKSVWPTVVEILNVEEDGTLPCETNTNITFTLAGRDYVVESKYYIDKYADKCYFAGHLQQFAQVDDFFTLPYTILRDKCLLLDFKNKQIGLTDLNWK